MLKRLSLAFALSLFAAGSAAAKVLNPGDSVLLNVSAQGASPVAIRASDGTFRELPYQEQKAEVQEVVAAYFKPGQRFVTYLDGRAGGQFVVDGFSPYGCFDFGFVPGRTLPALAAEGSVIAVTEGFPGPQAYQGRWNLTAADQRQARQLAEAAFVRQGLSRSAQKGLKLEAVRGLLLNQGQTRMLSIQAITESPGVNAPRVFLLVELQSKGPLTRYEVYHSGQDPDFFSLTLVSSFHSSPAQDAILLEGYGIESNFYFILQRQSDGSLKKVFTGGGGGC